MTEIVSSGVAGAPRSILTGFAILKVNAERNGTSYLENFVPFVSEALARLPPQRPTAAEISAEISATFGLTLPVGVVRTILERMQKSGQLQKLDDGSLRSTDSQQSRREISRESKRFLRQHEAFLGAFIEFAAVRGVDLDAKNAEAILLAFVESHGAAILSDEYDDDQERTPVVSPSREPAEHEYLLAAFAREGSRAEHLISLVKGIMLASSIYQDSEIAGKPFVDTTVYLDCKLLLRAIGYCGPELQAATLPTLELCANADARLACFHHTAEEMRGIVFAVMSSMTKGRRATQIQEVERHVFDNRFSHLDVQQMFDSIDDHLDALGVEQHDTPAYVDELSVDERALEAALRKQMPALNVQALQRDLLSLTAIHRLREGDAPYYLEKSRAIFATTSGGLCNVGRQFFAPPRGTLPVAIAEYQLQTAVWLKHPLKAPDLPRQVVIAHCYAALQPNDRLWTAYLREIENLTSTGGYSESDYMWLRYSPAAREELLERTLNTTGRLTQGLLLEILDARDDEIRLSYQQSVEAAEERAKAAEAESNEARRRLAERADEAAELKAQVDQLEAKLSKAGRYERQQARRQDKKKGDVSTHPPDTTGRAHEAEPSGPTAPADSGAARSQVEDLDARVDRIAEYIATLVTWLVVVPMAVVGLVCIVLTVYAVLPEGTWGREYITFRTDTVAGQVVIAAAAVITILSLVVGWNLRSTSRLLRQWLLRKVRDRLS